MLEAGTGQLSRWLTGGRVGEGSELVVPPNGEEERRIRPSEDIHVVVPW